MKKTLPWLLLLAAASSVGAQQLPTPEELVPRIHAYAKQYRASVPSFEVDESAVSQAWEDSQLKTEMKLEMTLREIRSQDNSDKLQDSYTFRLVDGKPPKRELMLPSFKRKVVIAPPYFVNGIFINIIGFGGQPGSHCTNYRVSAGPTNSTVKLELWNRPDADPEECPDRPEEFHKTLIVEPDTGRVWHVTRSMSAESARLHHDVVFADVEFAPQKLGDDTFLLPVRFESHNGPNDRRMTATYSNFHRYAATVKLLESNPLPEVGP